MQKISNHKEVFEPNPLFYLVHHPLKRDVVYVGPRTYFCTQKTKELYEFSGDYRRSKTIFGIKRARKKMSIINTQKSIKTMMSKDSSHISKFNSIARLILLDICARQNNGDISPLINE